MSGCKIKRARLDKIWSLAMEGFSPDAIIRITTERRTGELSSEFEGDTVDAVIEAVRGATLPGDPENIDNLYLLISERGSVRSVSIMIGGRALGPKVEVSVTGGDPGWVRGRIGGLRDLFAETRNGWFIGNGQIRFPLALAGFLVGFPVNTSVAALLPFVHTFPARIVLFVGGLAILTSICYVFGSRMDRRSRTELRLHEPPRRRIDPGWLGVIIGLLGVLVAIISSLAAHHVFPPVHASGTNIHGTKPGQAGAPWATLGPGADPARRGTGPAQSAAATAQPGTSPAQPGTSGPLVAGSRPAGPLYPGLSASWAEAGVSWAQTVASP